jgi:SSS family solute:Na+ symporter
MMPFYYGSKVRSVPEFMHRRFGTAAHLVNALSFALAQLLVAGINLYLLATVVNLLLGWSLFVSLVVAAAIVLTYTALGGLSAAIYNEVLQFFVIVAALLPLTIVGLHTVGGWDGLTEKVAHSTGGAEQLSSWPGQGLTLFGSPFWSVVGIVLGLGFVQSFGYWTTNFVEVQRAMASKSMSAAQRAPIIAAFPKMFIPFIVVFPGMIAAVVVNQIADPKNSGHVPDYNNAVLYLMRDLLPNGMLGVAIAGLLASFMAGMAANISAFNTVFSYDLWQAYVRKDEPDDHYIRVGRIATVAATLVAIGTALFASAYSNIMDYLQTLFGLFNAPLFGTFILGMFWKRTTPAAGWTGLVSGTVAAIAVGVLSKDALGPMSVGVIPGLSGQGASFAAAGAAFAVDVVVSVLVSLVTAPKPETELKGLVYSLTSKSDFHDPHGRELAWYQQPVKLAGVGAVLAIALNVVFW